MDLQGAISKNKYGYIKYRRNQIISKCIGILFSRSPKTNIFFKIDDNYTSFAVFLQKIEFFFEIVPLGMRTFSMADQILDQLLVVLGGLTLTKESFEEFAFGANIRSQLGLDTMFRSEFAKGRIRDLLPGIFVAESLPKRYQRVVVEEGLDFFSLLLEFLPPRWKTICFEKFDDSLFEGLGVRMLWWGAGFVVFVFSHASEGILRKFPPTIPKEFSRRMMRNGGQKGVLFRLLLDRRVVPP